MKRTDEEVLDEVYSTDYIDSLHRLKKEAKSKETKRIIQGIIDDLKYEN